MAATGRHDLVRARRRRGLSQGEVAKLVGVSQPYYALVEHGAKTPSLPVALRMAAVLRSSVEELFAQDAYTDPQRGKTRVRRRGNRPELGRRVPSQATLRVAGRDN